MKLKWKRYCLLTEARNNFTNRSCVYVQADSSGRPIRIGKASKGLNIRYRGGTGYALDAAMHNSGNLIFVAGVAPELSGLVESELIWRGRAILPYNNVGKKYPPLKRMKLVHVGDSPDFREFQ